MTVDIKMIEAARQGDKESFAQVYDSIAPDLFKVALYALGNAHDAEDAVSEAFLEAYKSIAKLREPAKFKSWMLTILSFRCKRKMGDYVKSKSVFDLESFQATLADETDMSSDVTDSVTVLHALSLLKPQERMIVVLSVLQGYTTKEIARILGSPQGTVSSKLHRSLGKMRKILEEQETQF